MKCYLINLDRSTDRLSYMDAQFRNLGLEYVRVPAVDGRSFSQVEVDAVTTTDTRWKAPLTRSEIGCFLSHRRCLEQIVSAPDPFAIVVEDDIEFAVDASELFKETDWIPSDADLLKLETNGKKVLLDLPNQCGDTRYSVARLHSTHIMSAGYIISRDAAVRLLARMDKIWAPIDQFIFSAEHGIFNELMIYQSTPALCRQVGLESTLDKDRRRAHQRPPLFRRVLREVRRAGRRSRIGLWGIWVNKATKQRWARVPFTSHV